IIKVVLLKPSGLAETEEGKDVKVEEGVQIRWCEPVGNRGGMKEGRVQWTVDLEARASKTLTLEWEVYHPPGQRWQYELQAPDTGVDARAVQDFNVNAADIFPVSHNKRLIGGLLSTVLDAVLPGGATTTTTQQTPAASSNQAPAPATSPTTTPQNQQTTAGSSPTTAGNSPATSPGATNQPANPGATSDVASNTQGSGNTSSPGKNGG
ncbi:4186_t:CDS:2, partial [Acaulospora colombiana]